MLYSLEYRNSEMHREGSPLTAVIGSTGLNTENGNTLHAATDSTQSECAGRTVGCGEVGPEHGDISSHDWIWGSNCLHPYSDPQSQLQSSNHQEMLGTSNNGYLPSPHYHHHHHHHHPMTNPTTTTSSTGLYMHNHHHRHHPNNHHHHHAQQEHEQQQHQQIQRNNSNQKYGFPAGSKPEERSPHHPALSLSVGYNAAAVAAAAAIAAAAAAAAVNSGGSGVSLTSGKPKRRRIPTVAQRRAANIRERRRMFNLNEAFDTLRKRVPTFAYEKRLSRIETLRLAITYISFMTDVISGKEPSHIKLHGTKTFAWETLHSLPPELSLHSKGPSSR